MGLTLASALGYGFHFSYGFRFGSLCVTVCSLDASSLCLMCSCDVYNGFCAFGLDLAFGCGFSLVVDFGLVLAFGYGCRFGFGYWFGSLCATVSLCELLKLWFWVFV